MLILYHQLDTPEGGLGKQIFFISPQGGTSCSSVSVLLRDPLTKYLQFNPYQFATPSLTPAQPTHVLVQTHIINPVYIVNTLGYCNPNLFLR